MSKDTNLDFQILKKPQVAKLLKLSERTIDYQIASKTLPHFHVGRSVRFRRDTLLEWIEKQEKANTKGGDTDA